MKKDIESRGDIELLVNSFYNKVKVDEVLGPIFTVIIPVNWAVHLPVMYQFWENAVFFTGGYTGNPMVMHAHLHKKIGLTTGQFARWLALFDETTDELFEGEKASLAKSRAYSIAKVMEQKILTSTGNESQ
jgi:hemoglobin